MSVCKHRVMDKCKKYDRPCIFNTDCFEPEEEKRMTNADRIRAMSDEELADFLNQWGTSTRAWQKDPGETLYWLQQTAGEEDKHEAD